MTHKIDKNMSWLFMSSITPGMGNGGVDYFIYSNCFNSISWYFSTISSGYNNLIAKNVCYSSISGGSCNTVSGTYSSIPGGNNNIVSHSYASASGHNIVSMADCTFYVNCLNACDTPPYTLGFPTGTIVYIACGDPIPSGSKALYIM